MVKQEQRLDRIFTLKEASTSIDSQFLDMVFYLPYTEGKKHRFWMLTEADSPTIMIDHHKFKPVRINEAKYRWIDFGIKKSPFTGPMGFGQIKFFGIRAEEAKRSYFVITSQTEQELYGSIEDVEEQLWGIKRSDVGTTFISPSTVEVGRPTTFTLIYQTSKKGLPRGSYIRLCVPLAFATPQMEREGEDGWLEMVRSDAPCKLFSIDVSKESHEQVDVIYSLPEGFPPHGEIVLTYKTEFTYLFEAVFNTMERRYWYSKLPPLAAAVAVDERMIFVPPLEGKGHSVRFIPAAPERLHLFLPGRREKGEEIKLTGIITDRYRNIVHRPPKMKIKLTIEGTKKEATLDIKKNFFATPYRFLVPLGSLEPGIYRVKATDKDTGRVIAVSNPLEIVDSRSKKPNIYWGEIHGHSEMSDGLGRFEEMFRHAKEIGTLDFAASGDHACYFTDNEWIWMQDIINFYNRPSEFCTIIGYEWAGKQGHRNIYTSKENHKLFRGMYEPTSNIEIVWKEFEDREDVVGGPHTRHTYDFWSGHNPRVERFLEIYSMWGSFDDLANKLLKEGAKLGFTGGGDCHEGHCFFSVEDRERQGQIPHGFAHSILYKCGITGVLMKELDRESLIYALRNRKTYATTGARILIDFSVSGITMGQEGKLSSFPIIETEIHGCDFIEKVEIIRDGEIVEVCYDTFLDKKFVWEDKKARRGNHWYYVKVYQKDGEIAWTSPVWVEIFL